MSKSPLWWLLLYVYPGAHIPSIHVHSNRVWVEGEPNNLLFYNRYSSPHFPRHQIVLAISRWTSQSANHFHFFYFLLPRVHCLRPRLRPLYSQFCRRLCVGLLSSFILYIYVSASLILLISLGTLHSCVHRYEYTRPPPGGFLFSFNFTVTLLVVRLAAHTQKPNYVWMEGVHKHWLAI